MDIVEEILSIIRRLEKERSIQSAAVFKSALLKHLQFVGDETAIKEVSQLFNKVPAGKIRKENKSAYLVGKPSDDCINCPETMLGKNIKLPVKETLPREKEYPSDAEVVREIMDVYEYKNPNQLAIHFGFGIDSDLVALDKLKEWTKVSHPPLFHKIKSRRAQHVDRAFQTVFEYLQKEKDAA